MKRDKSSLLEIRNIFRQLLHSVYFYHKQITKTTSLIHSARYYFFAGSDATRLGTQSRARTPHMQRAYVFPFYCTLSESLGSVASLQFVDFPKTLYTPAVHVVQVRQLSPWLMNQTWAITWHYSHNSQLRKAYLKWGTGSRFLDSFLIIADSLLYESMNYNQCCQKIVMLQLTRIAPFISTTRMCATQIRRDVPRSATSYQT